MMVIHSSSNTGSRNMDSVKMSDMQTCQIIASEPSVFTPESPPIQA